MSSLSSGLALLGEPVPSLPELPPTHVSRPRLADLFLSQPRRLRLLCAPAGFGKSALIAESLRHAGPERRYLWLRMGGQPMSLADFKLRLGELLGVPADSVLPLLEHPAEPLCLVLDDYPARHCAELDAWIDHQLMRPCVRLQFIVSCRERPDWNLPRLLLDDQLLQLGAGQLAFTREEFEALAEALGSRATEEQWRQTLGWCAGARLLLAQQQSSEAALWLRAYLDFELLPRLAPEERSMLFSLAYLPKLSADLCEQLWDVEGGRLFRRLLHGQLFFVPLAARGWYALVPLLAQALREYDGEPDLSRLRLRACRILYTAGHVDDAIELALSAGQPEVAASYMDRLGLEWLLTENRLSLLLGWRERLPAELLDSTPRLICQNARALLFSWRLDEAEQCLEQLGTFLPQPSAARNRRLLAHWQALSGALAGMRGNVAEAREHCQAALSSLRQGDWRATLLCYFSLGRVAMVTGQPSESRRLLQVAIELARREGCLASEVLINCDRIRQAILAGEQGVATVLLDDCLALVARSGKHHGLLLGRLRFLQGELDLARGSLGTGEAALLEGVRYADEAGDPFVLNGCISLAEVALARGDYKRAGAFLSEAERRMHCGRVQEACYEPVLQLGAMRLFARHGEWGEVLAIARRFDEQLSDVPERLPPLHMPSLPQRVSFLRALAECATGRADEGRARLKALRQVCERMQFRSVGREVQRTLAWVEKACDGLGAGSLERQEAIQADLACGLQSWLQQGPVMIERSVPGERMVGAEGEGGPLTSREIAVLTLLAQGLSNEEVGSRLFISLNTVKSHTKKINTKLGVKRRTQAIMRAKVLGILA